MLILIVDDDPLAGEMTGAVLEDGGHQVVLAENGLEAMERLADHPAVTLIVSDMHMPLMNGIELFRALREQGSTRPFILLTGDEPAGLLADEPALDGCLLKDFTLEERLPAAIAAVLARHPEL